MANKRTWFVKERGSHWPATSSVLRHERNATNVVNFEQGQKQNTYGSYALKLPNVHHQHGVLRRRDRRQLFQIRALLKEEQNSRSYIGTADLTLPLICDIHHMLRQKSLKEAYEDSEDSWRRRHEFLWRVEKYERQQKEEEKEKKERKQQMINRQKAETKETETVSRSNALRAQGLCVVPVEEKTNDEVEEQMIATSANHSNSSELKQKKKEGKQVEEQMIATSANRSNSSELRKKEQKEKEEQKDKENEIDGLLPVEDEKEERNITLPNLLREPPGLEQKKEDERLEHLEGTQKRKGARLYGAVKRNLTPTPAKFRICSDSDTDNSSTLNSDVSAPSHWWHETTSPNKRSQDQKRLNDNRLSRFKEDEVSDTTFIVDSDDGNFKCPDRSALSGFNSIAVISPCSRRIRPNSGLLEIQTEHSIEMMQPLRRGMGTE